MDSTVPAACTVARVTLGDLDVLTVDNGELTLAFLPQVGGRLISLRLHGDEILWRNPAYLADDLSPLVPHAQWPRPDGTMGSWANVGGNKTWPAPQGWTGPETWPGPPDEVLDSGAFRIRADVDERGAARVALTSAPDRRTGVSITRAFSIPTSGTSFTQVSTFVNHTAIPVRWSVWEVTQIDTTPRFGSADAGTFRVDAMSLDEPLRLLHVVGAGRFNVRPGAIEVPTQATVGKLGFPGASGRVTWLRGDGLRLEQSSARNPAAVYPDGGCPVELWLQYPLAEPLDRFGGLHPNAHLVEMELLSPLVEIPPGGRHSLDVAWRLDRAR